ncbi:MAG: hypothetical protein KF685_04070 [Acidobacteria bacterium]|nr:hypothetical protein [Acidobacteriota bacterium]
MPANNGCEYVLAMAKDMVDIVCDKRLDKRGHSCCEDDRSASCVFRALLELWSGDRPAVLLLWKCRRGDDKV